MLKIDERFNIEKSVVDCQMMCLELFNVYADCIEDVIMRIYGNEHEEVINNYKFYEECGIVKVFFLINDNLKKGEYKYNLELALKEKCKINVLDERSFIVYD